MAKQAPLQIGKPNPHIMQSRGADNYIMNFYVTNYSTSFTKPSIDFNKSRQNDIPVYSGHAPFVPRSAPEVKKTGYIANVRPQIYYRRELDELDNPQMGRMLAENYDTMTNIQFQPYKTLDGTEELPAQVLGQKTAYTQNAYHHNAREAEVKSQFIDTNIRAPYDVIPKYRTRLDRINEKDPIKSENYGHGPKYMTSEYKTKYETPVAIEPDKNHSSIGPKEESGFVENKEMEDTLTGVPGERWLYNDRETGISVYQDKHVPFSYAMNTTQLPNICNIPSTKDSTYVKTFRPTHVNPKNINYPKTTEFRETYTNKPKQITRAENLGTAYIGPVEESAQAICEKGFTQTLDDRRRFITTYQINHFDRIPKGKDREGYVTGGVNKIEPDGYVKNVKVHNAGGRHTTAELYSMDPYQSRSVRFKDTFFNDYAHDHKFTLKENNVFSFQDGNPYAVKTNV